MSAHGGEEILEARSSKTQSIPRDPEVIQESLQNAETIAIGEMSEGPEVIAEPPQINPTLA